jgi:hypothetical protein
MNVRRFFPALVVGLTPLCSGCGSGGGNGLGGEVGTYDPEGGLFSGAGDASGPVGFDAHIEQNHVTVTFVTLSCSGPCADVVAVPTGGNAPYTFEWDDGSTSASRHVCPTSSTNYDVKVTDTGTSGELARPAETVQVPLKANVSACPDGGEAGAACDGGTVTPASGAYSGSYTSVDLGGLQTGSITLTLANASGAQLSGSFTADVVGILHTMGSLTGSVDCATGAIVMRGMSVDGKSYVYTMSYDPSTKALRGTWSYTCPAGVNCNGEPDGGGDSGTFAATWSGP